MTATIVNEMTRPIFTQEFAKDVMLGLSAKPKYLKPKYFYDYIGSNLFEDICRQPEYYLTKTEASILETIAPDIPRMQYHNNNDDDVSDGINAIIELGSGSSSKTRILLRSFLEVKQKPIFYFPIDISHSILQDTAKMLSSEFPMLKVLGLSTDYIDGIDKANGLIYNEAKNNDGLSAQKIILFLGSSIGNFEPKEAKSFLNVLANRLNKGDSILVGFDLHKDEESVLNRAYNDSAGITARFNLNILHRINKELGGEFDSSLFKHWAFYNKHKMRVEMHLVSKCKQKVYIKKIDKTFTFKDGESIHTENSYKYTIKQIDGLAKLCGLKVKKHFTDKNCWFDLVLFERRQ